MIQSAPSGQPPPTLSEVQPSTIQGWLRTLADLAPTYRKVVFANVSTIFTAAVDDELIPKNPCKAPSVRKPRSDPKKLVAWTNQRVLAVRDELPERYRLVAWLGAGLGLRQGETIRAVSEYLGHADPGFTLRTYTHLMEGRAERTKKAIDAAFRGEVGPVSPTGEGEDVDR